MRTISSELLGFGFAIFLDVFRCESINWSSLEVVVSGRVPW